MAKKATCQADGGNGRGPLGEGAEKFFRSRRSQRCSCWRSGLPPAFIFHRFQMTPRQFRAGTRIKFSSRKMEYSSSSQQRARAIQRRRSRVQSLPNHGRLRTDYRNDRGDQHCSGPDADTDRSPSRGTSATAEVPLSEGEFPSRSSKSQAISQHRRSGNVLV